MCGPDSAGLLEVPGLQGVLACPRCSPGLGGDGVGGRAGCYKSEQEEHLYGPDCKACCHVNWATAPEYTSVDSLSQRFKPAWYISTDALFLMRDSSNERPFVRNSGGGDVIHTRELDFELEGGVKFLVSRAFTDDFLIEAAYLGMQSWDDSIAVRDTSPNVLGGTGNLSSLIGEFNGSLPGIDFNNFASLNVSSHLQSIELNYRRRIGLICGPLETSMLFGARYLNVRELLDFITVADAPVATTNALNVRATNHLLGLQAGGLAAYRVSDKMWLESDVKIGLYQNSASQTTLYQVTTPAGLTSFPSSAHRGSVAVVGDFDFTAHARLTRNLSMHLGYQLLAVDGLALARDNVQENLALLTLGPAVVRDNGLVLYHGPHIGAVVSW